jgi:hypothetical protein
MTVAAGIALGLDTWVVEQPGWPSPGVHDALVVPLAVVAWTSLLLVPLIVGRWWVLGSLAGPGLALLLMQMTGVATRLDDGTGPAFNYRTIFFLIVVGLVMLVMVGVRHAFDPGHSSWRDRQRAEPPAHEV